LPFLLENVAEGANVMQAARIRVAITMAATEITHAVYAKIENRPGALQHLSRVLAHQNINLDAVGLETVGGTGCVRFLSSRMVSAVDALRKAGIEAHESELVVVSVPNRVGQLTLVAGELAAAGINVEAVLTTAEGRIALRTSDNERAAQVLRKL
jgi:hypothetical protein